MKDFNFENLQSERISQEEFEQMDKEMQTTEGRKKLMISAMKVGLLLSNDMDDFLETIASANLQMMEQFDKDMSKAMDEIKALKKQLA